MFLQVSGYEQAADAVWVNTDLIIRIDRSVLEKVRYHLTVGRGLPDIEVTESRGIKALEVFLKHQLQA